MEFLCDRKFRSKTGNAIVTYLRATADGLLVSIWDDPYRKQIFSIIEQRVPC